MKKIGGVALIVCFWAGIAFALDFFPTVSTLSFYNYTNITTATTTTIKETPGVLGGLVVNGGTMGSITVYDQTSAAAPTIATIASPFAGQVIPFGCQLKNGLTVVTAGATNVTVFWK